MATTIPACMALLPDSTGSGRRGITAWDDIPVGTTTAAQRTAVITSLLAGTVTTQADVLALIASAASGNSVSQFQVYCIMAQNPATVG